MGKRFLYILICCALVVSLTTAASLYVPAYAADLPKYSGGSSLPQPPVSYAESLSLLGIMNGYGTLPDGTVDYGLSDDITRQSVIAMLVRALGHSRECDLNSYDMPFTDVASWATGIVGYAYESGITKGISENLLGADLTITGRDLTALMLRSLGYVSEYTYQETTLFSDSIDLTHGQFGNGASPVTRGEAAEVFYTFMGLEFKGENYTVIQFLVDTGVVEYNTAIAAGYTVSMDSALLSANQVWENFSDKLFTLVPKDIDGVSMPSVTGTYIGDGVGTASLEGIYGAVELTVNGSPLSVLGYDSEKGIIYLEMPKGNSFFSGEITVYEKGEVVYVISEKVAASGRTTDFGTTCVAPAGLPAVTSKGDFIGITTSATTLTDLSFSKEPMTVTELAQLLWPQVFIPPEPEYPRGIDPEKPMVAITYDDGPHLTHTPELLDLLEEYGVVATFFEVGSRLKTMPQFLSRMDEMGCEIGNHSYSHKNFTKLSSDGILNEIESTNAIIREQVGHNASLVRVPGGNVNDTVKSTIAFPIISWCVDTLDWKTLDADKVIKSVKSTEKLDGAIILMHSLYSSTVEASETIIPWLLDQGYQLVTVSELAEYKGYELENGKVYYSFR